MGILIALVLGIVLPGTVFSVAEKLYTNKTEGQNLETVVQDESDDIVAETICSDDVLVLFDNGSLQQMDMLQYI